MRITIILLAAVVLGAAFGSALAAWSFYRLPDYATVQHAASNEDPDKKYPSVEVNEDDYDFGAMDGHATGTHEFIFRNVGDAPLELEAGATTCKCTLSDIGDGSIQPGQSGSVTLEWKGKGLVGPFAQTASILTNDPKQRKVDLRIHGELTAKTRVIPDVLVFSSVMAGHSAQGDVRIYGYMDEPLDIAGYEVDNPESLQVSFSAMSSDEVEEEEYATCGQRMSVTLKPGLPPGPFKRKIRVMTNVEGLEELTIPVEGTITSEISIFGSGWSAERGVLRFGTLEKAKAVRRLLVRVGGPHPENVQFEVAEVQPEFVQVRLAEKTSPPGSSAAVTPVEIEIPEGSPPGNYRGPKKLGHVRLRVTNATVKELDIKLEFLIGG